MHPSNEPQFSTIILNDTSIQKLRVQLLQSMQEKGMIYLIEFGC